MSDPGPLSGEVIGQIALMQSVAVQLPDRTSILQFVCEGLRDIPGVQSVECADSGNLAPSHDRPTRTFAIRHRDSTYAHLVFHIDDADQYLPYAPFVENFCGILALALEERRQREINQVLFDSLEARVAERTRELNSEIQERKRVEGSLRESEHRFRSFVENATDTIFTLSPEGVFTYLSPYWFDLSGESVEETVGKPFEPYVHPGDVSRWRDYLQTVLATGKQQGSIEHRVRRRDGACRWCVSNGSALHDDAGRIIGLLGIARDVTGRKQAEQRMASFAAVVENSDNIIVVKDLDLRVVATNQAFAKVLGHASVDNMIGKTDAEIFGVSPDTEPVRSYMEDELHAQTLPPGESLLREEPVIAADGEVRTLLTKKYPIYGRNGKLIGTGSISTDITDLKRAETALRESEQRLIAASEASLDSFIICKSLEDDDGETIDFVFEQVNPESCRFMRLSREEIIGQRICELFPINRTAGFFDRYKTVLETGEPLEEEFFLPEYEIWCVHQVVKIGNAIAISTRDITEKKEMEERIRQSEKMDAIGKLAGGVAHDFNNQLAGVMGYADLLLTHLKEPKLQRYAERIKMAAARSSSLTRQLLAFSRQGQYESTVVDVHVMINEVTDILSRSVDKKINIQQLLRANPATTRGDPSQIQNALLNLAINAADAMPDGGELIFDTSVKELTEINCRDLSSEIMPGCYLRVCVTDSGEGIPKELQERIFEPFFTTKEVGKGTGMGLASVFGTVKLMGGAIDVYSEIGQGATFRLYLPLEHPEEQLPQQEQSPAALRTGALVLVIDDEDGFRDIAVDMLDSLACRVHVAEDGQAGVEYFRDHWQEIDLVLLDMVMPKMNGPETFQAMKAIHPDLKVLLASGYSLNGAAQNLLAEGALGFVQKPFDRFELSTKVAEALQDESA